jgi:MOB kinase activator 1
LDDGKVFPTSKSTPFPKTFGRIVKDIFKWIFRIYAHLMIVHWKDIKDFKFEGEIHSSFKHFMYFAFEFDLIGKKEVAPLKDWVLNNIPSKYEHLFK